MNLQRVLLASGSILLIGLVIIVVIQFRNMEHFMEIQKNQRVRGKNLPAINEVLDITMCQKRCKKDPNCRAATIKSNGRCRLKSTIGTTVPDERYSSLRYPCEIYDSTDFIGNGVYLDVGKYNLTRLRRKGLNNNSASSIRLLPGYKITIYNGHEFNGRRTTFNTSQTNLNSSIRDPSKTPPLTWMDAISSVLVEKDI